MMQNKYIFSLVSFIVALVSYAISSIPQYQDVKTNVLFVFFMLLVYATIGTIIGEALSGDKEKKPKKSKKEVKINEL